MELENVVIGCLILEQQTAREYVNKLKPEYFCEEDNRLIHRTIRDLVNQDREVDVFIIAAQLKKAGMQKELQEIAYLLTSRTEVVASSAHMEYYVEELRLFALRRKLNGLALRLQKESMDLTLEADALVETYETALQNLQAERPWEEVFRTQWQVAGEAFLKREQALARGQVLVQEQVQERELVRAQAAPCLTSRASSAVATPTSCATTPFPAHLATAPK